MCSNHNAIATPDRMRIQFGVEVPPDIKSSVWPLYEAPFIRRHPHALVGDDTVPAREALGAWFGLTPHWARELSFGPPTYNTRPETAPERPSYRDACLNTLATCSADLMWHFLAMLLLASAEEDKGKRPASSA
jgi:putative SOS response-associated peptidase YedK